ncbi:MAG: hypothetical protein R2710_16225 [Acidimicrobiales bacterium]
MTDEVGHHGIAQSTGGSEWLPGHGPYVLLELRHGAAASVQWPELWTRGANSLATTDRRRGRRVRDRTPT